MSRPTQQSWSFLKLAFSGLQKLGASTELIWLTKIILHSVMYLINMKIFLNSYWLRAVQFQGNTELKKICTVICPETFMGTVLLFSCIDLLMCNSMTSCAIWENMYS